MLCSPRAVHALAVDGQLPRSLAAVHSRYDTPARAVIAYSALCLLLAVSGSFRQLAILSSSGMLLLYLICCLAVLRLWGRQVSMAGEPFRAPGGPFAPLAASAIIVWMLATLEWKELIAAGGLVLVSGGVYRIREARVWEPTLGPDRLRDSSD